MSDGRLVLANAINKKTVREARRQHNIRRGNVTGIRPLTIELDDFNVPLVLDEDFFLSAWAQWYEKTIGLVVDDVVLCHEGVDWLLFDVLGDPTGTEVDTAMKAGAAGGDLSGRFPNPKVATVLNGKTPATEGDLNSLQSEVTSLSSTVTSLSSTVSALSGAAGKAMNLAPGTAPAAPSSGVTIYVDSADGHLKAIDTAGTITVLAS